MLQVRVDDFTKQKAAEIYAKLGLDLSTAIRIFLLKSIAEGGLPFEMKLSEVDSNAIKAIDKMRTISEANGNSEMTLEEINEEIKLARSERKKRNDKNICGN